MSTTIIRLVTARITSSMCMLITFLYCPLHERQNMLQKYYRPTVYKTVVQQAWSITGPQDSVIRINILCIMFLSNFWQIERASITRFVCTHRSNSTRTQLSIRECKWKMKVKIKVMQDNWECYLNFLLSVSALRLKFLHSCCKI